MDILYKSADGITLKKEEKILPRFFLFLSSYRCYIFINMIFKSNLGNQEASNTKRIDSK